MIRFEKKPVLHRQGCDRLCSQMCQVKPPKAYSLAACSVNPLVNDTHPVSFSSVVVLENHSMLASSVPATRGFGSCREKRASVVLLHKSHIFLPSFQKY